jgi:hypothetical protein
MIQKVLQPDVQAPQWMIILRIAGMTFYLKRTTIL